MEKACEPCTPKPSSLQGVKGEAGGMRRKAHLEVVASSVTRGGMAEGGDVSDTAQLGHSARAADMGDGALAPTAGAEKGRGCPESQCQFWMGRGAADGARWREGSASQGE